MLSEISRGVATGSLPNGFHVERFISNSLAAENLGMYADDQDENSNPARSADKKRIIYDLSVSSDPQANPQ